MERTRAEVQGLVTGFAVGWLAGNVFLLSLMIFALPTELIIMLAIAGNFLANVLGMRMSAIDRSDRDLQ